MLGMMGGAPDIDEYRDGSPRAEAERSSSDESGAS
jgi:hypothetical protein